MQLLLALGRPRGGRWVLPFSSFVFSEPRGPFFWLQSLSRSFLLLHRIRFVLFSSLYLRVSALFFSFFQSIALQSVIVSGEWSFLCLFFRLLVLWLVAVFSRCCFSGDHLCIVVFECARASVLL